MRSFSMSRTHSPLRSGVLLTLASTVALVGFQRPAPQQHARVGICQRDITPISPSLIDEYGVAFGEVAVVNHTDPVFMAGFGDNRQATGYHDQLWARGVVVDGAGGRVAIVALDVVGYFNK